jgi:predicted DCC family thiol-disulfide oxidoreductase YuxK
MPILIFDGDCGFCTTVANYVERKSKTRILAHPWQTTELEPFKLTKEQAADRVWLVLDGKHFGGHECFCMLLRLQRNPLLTFLGWLFMTPALGWLSAIGYRLIARFRHRLPGGTPACQMPNAKPRI